MEAVEERAARVLERVPPWLWDGESLPVPVEDIADSVFGLLVRDVDDLGTAPGAPALARGQQLSGLLLAARSEIWVNAQEARTWPTRRRFTIGHELGHCELHRDGQTPSSAARAPWTRLSAPPSRTSRRRRAAFPRRC